MDRAGIKLEEVAAVFSVMIQGEPGVGEQELLMSVGLVGKVLSTQAGTNKELHGWTDCLINK